MSRDQIFLEWLLQQFGAVRDLSQCLHESDATATVVCEADNQGGPCIFQVDAIEGFWIVNSHGKRIHLLATDNCFFTARDPTRCDCLVFDDNCCCFVELKLNVIKGNGAERAKEARKQLGMTIKFFNDAAQDASLDFFGFVREAYVVMKDHVYPRAPRVPIFEQFLTEYNVRLFEANTKTF